MTVYLLHLYIYCIYYLSTELGPYRQSFRCSVQQAEAQYHSYYLGIQQKVTCVIFI